MTNGVDWEAVLAQYQRELGNLQNEFAQRQHFLQTIIDDVKRKAAETPKAVPPATAVPAGEYAEMKLLDAAVAYLNTVNMAAEAKVIAQALVRGGFQPKGDPDNFPKSVYNQLKTESDRRGGRLVQLEDKRFRVARMADLLPEPGPGSQPGIAFPSETSDSLRPVFAPSGFGGATGDR